MFSQKNFHTDCPTRFGSSATQSFGNKTVEDPDTGQG